jgi:hypothetical protein
VHPVPDPLNFFTGIVYFLFCILLIVCNVPFIARSFVCCALFERGVLKKLHGLSPLANYTDRATAARQRS